MTAGRRVTVVQAERIAASLSDRDWAIIRSLAATRLLTGSQLTRLHFHPLSPLTADRTRRRVLTRLKDWQVVAALTRTIGGVRAGSSGLVFTLGVAGQRLLTLDTSREPQTRIRKPWTPGRLFLAHSLAVAEQYVALVERSRVAGFELTSFQTEPACWWPDGLGGFIKPDAFLVLRTSRYDELVWLEVDRATESVPTVRRKLLGYLDFMARGQLGPEGVMPHVVISTPDDKRCAELGQLVTTLPEVADGLFTVTTAASTTDFLTGLAMGQAIKPP